MSCFNCHSLNAHHSVAAINNIFQRLPDLHDFIYCIQEPYIPRNRIPGIPRGVTAIYHSKSKARAAILYQSNLNVWEMPAFTGPDISTCLVKTNNAMYKEVIITSVYLDITYRNEDFLPKELKNLVLYCKLNKKSLIINMDSNCHSDLWGHETNHRGEVIEEYIIANGLKVQNVGKEPTFVTKRAEINVKTNIDVTLTLNFDDIIEWSVTNEITFSDHKEIAYKVDFRISNKARIIYQTKKLNVEKYNQDIREKLPEIPNVITKDWVNKSSKKLSEIITSCFIRNCPKIKKKHSANKPQYWNGDIAGARKGAKKSL